MANLDNPAPAGANPPEPPPAAPPDNMPAQDPRWTDQIFRAGLMVGGALLIVGLLCQAFNLVEPTLSSLIICSGLGIIFGAFGSTAVVRYKGFVVAGVATIAIALLLVVDYLVRDDIVRLRIDGDVRGARLDLLGDEALPGADHGKYFEFVVIGREIKSQRMSLIVTLPPAPPARVDPTEVSFECVPPSEIAKFLGSGKTVQWRFDAKTQRLVFGLGDSLQSGPCEDKSSPPPVARNGGFLVSSALAQDQPDIKQLLLDLESESAVVRRDARKQLTQLGASAVPIMTQHLQELPDNYRVRLGVSVALAEFLRDHKDQRKAVAATITDPQMELLTAAAGDPDRTIRIYASEFLYDLGDKRVIPIAQRLFDQASDDGKYNLIVVLQGAIPDLAPAEKQALTGTLRTWQQGVGTSTQALITKALGAANQ